MEQTPDRRLGSTTPKRLSEFVGALLQSGIPSTSVRNLQKGFQQHRFYPARDLPQFCVPEPPDVFLSYYSAQNFVDIQEIVWRAIDHAAEQLVRVRPGLTREDLEPMVRDGVRLWVDFMFIDQSARDLRTELDVLPQLLRGASAHFVLGSQPLMRSWCCYEIALFNRHLVASDAPRGAGEAGSSLRSFIAPTRSFYRGWDLTETSEPEDKAFIAERIGTDFPRGFVGFDELMAQANSVAVGPLASAATWSTPGADEHLARAAESWFARMGHAGASGDAAPAKAGGEGLTDRRGSS